MVSVICHASKCSNRAGSLAEAMLFPMQYNGAHYVEFLYIPSNYSTLASDAHQDLTELLYKLRGEAYVDLFKSTIHEWEFDYDLIVEDVNDPQSDLKDVIPLSLLNKIKIEISCKTKLETLKQHTNYKKMQNKGMELSDNELLAIIHYTHYDESCLAMKQSVMYPEPMNELKEKWKQRYSDLCCGVEKLYKVFHFKNKNTKKIKHLFHGSSNNLELDSFSIQSSLIETTMSFTTDWKVAKRFANSRGLILQLDNVGKAMYDGTMRAADVSWISKWNENEYIVLPTKFSKFQIGDERSLENMVYSTSSYKSQPSIILDIITSLIYDELNKWMDKILPHYNQFSALLNLPSTRKMIQITLDSMMRSLMTDCVV